MEYLPPRLPALRARLPVRPLSPSGTREGLLRGRGPLDERTARLVKLGIALGAQAEGAVRSHARRALSEGESREEVRHVGLLALTTIGFPHTIAGLGWIEVIEAAS
jgi:4-carboxymuconolactone decarboxylase